MFWGQFWKKRKQKKKKKTRTDEQIMNSLTCHIYQPIIWLNIHAFRVVVSFDMNFKQINFTSGTITRSSIIAFYFLFVVFFSSIFLLHTRYQYQYQYLKLWRIACIIFNINIWNIVCFCFWFFFFCPSCFCAQVRLRLFKCMFFSFDKTFQSVLLFQTMQLHFYLSLCLHWECAAWAVSSAMATASTSTSTHRSYSK